MRHAARGAAMVVRCERASVFSSALAALAPGAADAGLAARIGIGGESHRRPQKDDDQGRQRKNRRSTATGAEKCGWHPIDDRLKGPTRQPGPVRGSRGQPLAPESILVLFPPPGSRRGPGSLLSSFSRGPMRGTLRAVWRYVDHTRSPVPPFSPWNERAWIRFPLGTCEPRSIHKLDPRYGPLPGRRRATQNISHPGPRPQLAAAALRSYHRTGRTPLEVRNAFCSSHPHPS